MALSSPDLCMLDRRIWEYIVRTMMTPDEALKTILAFKQCCTTPTIVETCTHRSFNFARTSIGSIRKIKLKETILEAVKTDNVFVMICLLDMYRSTNPRCVNHFREAVAEIITPSLLDLVPTVRTLRWLIQFGMTERSGSKVRNAWYNLAEVSRTQDNPIFAHMLIAHNPTDLVTKALNHTLTTALAANQFNIARTIFNAALRGLVILSSETKYYCRFLSKRAKVMVLVANTSVIERLKYELTCKILLENEHLSAETQTTPLNLGPDLMRLIVVEPNSLLSIRATCKTMKMFVDSWAKKKNPAESLTTYLLRALHGNDLPTLIHVGASNCLTTGTVKTFFNECSIANPITNLSLLKELMLDTKIRIGTYVWLQQHILPTIGHTMGSTPITSSLEKQGIGKFADNLILAGFQVGWLWNCRIDSGRMLVIMRHGSIDLVVLCFQLLLRIRPEWLNEKTFDEWIVAIEQKASAASPKDVTSIWDPMSDALINLGRCMGFHT